MTTESRRPAKLLRHRLGCESADVKDLWSGSSATESGGVWREVDESSMVMLVLTCK